ncbi:MAG: MoaD/ThiS family protein [Acidobacteria bacterium]|nr:MoaD/ThiS family protein [Acidobacteriota bacterium]
MITVRLPSMLRAGRSDTMVVTEPVATIAELVAVLDRRIPGLRDKLEDSVFNFAVNDEMLLHRVRDRRLADGDIVELIPTISGGEEALGPGIRGQGPVQSPIYRPTGP